MITNMDKQIKLSKTRNFRVSRKAILSHFNFVYRNQKLWMLLSVVLFQDRCRVCGTIS